MHERQKHGLHREVVPRVVERRTPDHDPSGALSLLRHRHPPVIEAGQDAVRGSGLQRPVSKEPHVGEVPAARRLERLEHRVTVVEKADRSAAPDRAIDGRAQGAREQARIARRPTAVLAEHHEQAAAALDEAPQGGARLTGRKGDVVENHDRWLLEGRRAQARRRDRLDLELGHGADRQRPGEVKARIAAGAIRLDQEHDDRTGRREDEVEHVVLGKPIRAGDAGAHHAAQIRLRQRKGREGDRRRAVRSDAHRLGLNHVTVDFEGDRQRGDGAGALVRQARGNRDALLIGKPLAGERDRRHRHVGGIGGGDRDRREHGAFRKMQILGPLPAHSLEVRDQDGFAALQGRLRKEALSQLQGWSEARRARADAGGVEGREEARLVGRRLDALFRILREQHERRPIVAGEPLDGLTGGAARSFPVVAVMHAGGLIQQNHHLARADRCRRRQRSLAEERPRKGRDDHREGRRPHQKQGPVADTPAANRLIRNSPQKHQRGKFDDALSLPLDEVHDDRDRERGEAGQEDRG